MSLPVWIRQGDEERWVRHSDGNLPLRAYNTDVSLVFPKGLKEGDHIISVNGHNVTTEREFIDQLFANQDHKQPVPIAACSDRPCNKTETWRSVRP